jgi:hypothetical protein
MSRPRFLADNDLNDAIVVGVRRREPTAEFARLRELGLAAGLPMNGLLLAHQRTPVSAIIDSRLFIWAASDAEGWAAQVEFLPI